MERTVIEKHTYIYNTYMTHSHIVVSAVRDSFSLTYSIKKCSSKKGRFEHVAFVAVLCMMLVACGSSCLYETFRGGWRLWRLMRCDCTCSRGGTWMVPYTRRWILHGWVGRLSLLSADSREKNLKLKILWVPAKFQSYCRKQTMD